MRTRLTIVVGTILTCTGCTSGSAQEGPTDASSTEFESTDALSTTDTSVDDTTTDAGSSTGPSTTGELSTSGADTTSEPETFDYEGDHVVLIDVSPTEPCAGTMAHMDDFVKSLANRLGRVAPTGDGRIRFTWARDAEAATELCGLPELVVGCARENNVYSWSLPHNHELVHAIAAPLGLPAPFFAEGLAVAHEGYGGWPVPKHIFTDNTEDILDLIALPSAELGNIEGGYEAAGRFTAYLIDHHGIDSYLELYSAIPRDATIEEIDHLFQDFLGVSLAQSVADYGDPWVDIASSFDPQLAACNAPEIAWDGQLLEMETSIACANEGAIGPYDVGKVEEQYTIEIPADGSYELRIVGDEAEATPDQDFFDLDFSPPFIGVSMLPCEIGTPGFMETRVNGTPRLGHLTAGLHSLRVLGSYDLHLSFAFTLKRLPDP